MWQLDQDRTPFFIGFLASAALHAVLAVVVVIILERAAADAAKAPEVFTVTLEGGVNLGGISQVPKEGATKILTPEQAADEPPPEVKAPPEPKEEAKLTQPAVVDDPEKILAEKKRAEEKVLHEKKLAEEKKLKEQQQKEEEKKRREEEKLKNEKEKKEEEERQAKEQEKQKREQDAKKKEDDRKKRDKQLTDALNRLKHRYEGESADAGGKGFGAAKIGGRGMGGGILAAREKIEYQNTLQRHVKSGWRWLGGADRLRAQVHVQILPSGETKDVRIMQTSGNRNFDDSVLRAVLKASPVPPPPSQFYDDFKEVTFWFDSSEL